MKAKINSFTSGTLESVTEKNSIVEGLAIEVIEMITKEDLNYRQALAVLELAQAEIKECKLVY